MATTPPPFTRAETPSTPRHGVIYEDTRESPLRRSARLLNRKILRDTTPSEANSPIGTNRGRSAGAATPDVDVRKPSASTFRSLSPMPSMPTSPKRRSVKPATASHPRQSSLHDMTRKAATSSHTASRTQSHNASEALDRPRFLPAHTSLTASMLPTPAKTPKKKKVASQPGSAARVLFPPRATETEMPPSKRMKGASLDEISMENFGCGRRSRKNDIEVFVDSRDQIPDVNLSKENPFIVHSDDEEEEEEEEEEETAPPSPSKGIQQKERQLDKGNEIRKPGIEKSVHRDDGMLYTFRGKKIFKKFEEEEEEDEDEDEDLEASLLNELDEDLADMKPLSRSSIKPKVLFPTSKPKRTPAPGAPDVFVRTPSPEATVPERMTPEAEANDAEPIDDEPQKTTEVDEDEQSLPQTDGAPLASSPPATPAKQCPTTVMPQTPRTLRPRGIKAYLSPIKSASKPQPKKRTIEPHQPSEQQEQSQQPHQREHRQTPDQEESPSSQDSAPPPAETPAREGRTLRSHHAAVEARLKSPEPVAEKKKRGSPFDSWRRTKPTAAAASPTTRAGGKVKKRTATTAPSAEAEAPVEAVNSKKVRSK